MQLCVSQLINVMGLCACFFVSPYASTFIGGSKHIHCLIIGAKQGDFEVLKASLDTMKHNLGVLMIRS